MGCEWLSNTLDISLTVTDMKTDSNINYTVIVTCATLMYKMTLLIIDKNILINNSDQHIDQQQ